MNAPSEDIKDMLVAKSSLGLTYEDNLFRGFEPDEPNNCVTIFDTGGAPPRLTLGGENYEYPAVQIRTRNVDYDTAWSEIEGIKNELHGQAQETYNGTLYSIIYCSSGPMFLDYDEKGRARFVVNFNMQRR